MKMEPADTQDRVSRLLCPECGSGKHLLIPAQAPILVADGRLMLTLHICLSCGYIRHFLDTQSLRWAQELRPL